MELSPRNLAVRCFLIGAIGRDEPDLPTYGDLHRMFGGGFQNQGRYLEQIYENCTANGEPDVTVLAVNSTTRFPSRFEQKAFERTPEVIDRWRAAREALAAHPWSNTRFY